jgi:hypothetical protein
MRLRVFAVLVGVTLAAIGAVSLAAVPLWPVLGVAFATVALCVNTMTSRLAGPVCWGCGEDIARLPSGEYGVMCPKCGTLTQDQGRQGRA